MNLKKANTIVNKTIKGKQDPDNIVYTKQWDEFGGLKGWIVNIEWGESKIFLDITAHYIRVNGDLESIPEYIKGKHQIDNHKKTLELIKEL